eukprot:2713312-Rhodomonas_salina.3
MAYGAARRPVSWMPRARPRSVSPYRVLRGDNHVPPTVGCAGMCGSYGARDRSSGSCPPIALRCCYAMPGTDLAYAALDHPRRRPDLRARRRPGLKSPSGLHTVRSQT